VSPAPAARSLNVVGRLSAAVAAQRLLSDAAQLAAAARLDALREALWAARPPGRMAWLARRGAKPPRGVYLWGGVGRGKTMLMDLFFSSLEDQESAPPAERSHFYRFMQGVHRELKLIDEPEPLERVAERLAARIRVLCLDEFLVADIADAMILARLFEGLFRHGVVLVATSNLPPSELYRDGLQRQRFLPAIELLGKHLDVVRLDGGLDYRLRELEQAPTYLNCTLPGTAAALRRRFDEFTGGVATGPTTLTIEGRAMRALDTGPGTVWFGFAELCGGPRSQNDYIEIARTHQTVFIADIPILGADDDNAARRFIMLLDELYDRGVSIVVSAAAAPAALYRGERLRFDFERTASRLIEMQSRDYLAGRPRSGSQAHGIIEP
jgi:cell division protein ZapE